MKKDLFTKWPPTLYTRAKTLLLLFPITQKVSSILFFFFFFAALLFLCRSRTRERVVRTHTRTLSGRLSLTLSRPLPHPVTPFVVIVVVAARPPARPADQKGLKSSSLPLPVTARPSGRTLPCRRSRRRRIVTVTPLISSFPPPDRATPLARAQSSPVVCTNMAAAFEPSLPATGTPSLAPPPPSPDRIGCLVPSDYQYRSAGPRAPSKTPTRKRSPYGFFSRLPAAAPRVARRRVDQ